MKKNALLSALLAATVSLSLCACSDNGGSDTQETAKPEETQDLHIYESAEGVLKESKRYNSNGLLFSTYVYDYDEYGREIRETALGVNDAPLSKTEYEYDDAGRVIKETSYLATGPEEFEEDHSTAYEYDASGNKIKETVSENGDVSSQTEFTYDGTKLINEKYYEGAELLNERSYEYDEAGNVSKCVMTDNIEGTTQEEARSYDDAGRLIKSVVTSGGAAVSTTEYTYDEHGSELSVTITNSSGETVSKTEYEYTYDIPGNITKCVTKINGEQDSVTENEWEYVKG